MCTVCLLLSSLITGGDLSLPGQRVVALAILFDIYKQDNPFGSLFLHLLEGKPGLLPLAPQERLFIGQLFGFLPVNIKDVSVVYFTLIFNLKTVCFKSFTTYSGWATDANKQFPLNKQVILSEEVLGLAEDRQRMLSKIIYIVC